MPNDGSKLRSHRAAPGHQTRNAAQVAAPCAMTGCCSPARRASHQAAGAWSPCLGPGLGVALAALSALTLWRTAVLRQLAGVALGRNPLL